MEHNHYFLLYIIFSKNEVRRVTSTKTLQKAFNEFGVPQDKLNELAIINCSELNDTIEAGTLIKVIS